MDASDSASPASDCSESKALVAEVKRLTRAASMAEHRLASDVSAALSALAPDVTDHQARITALAQRLTAHGYQVALRSALGGGDGSECLHNLRHCFLAVALQQQRQQQQQQQGQQQQGQQQQGQQQQGQQGQQGQQHHHHHHPQPRHIIDPYFKEQFIIAAPSSRYQRLLDALPEAFVGPEPFLLALVDLLCREMAASFKQQGSVMPPWRQPASILSKWQPSPRRSVDSPVGDADVSQWRQLQREQAAQAARQQQRLGGQAAMLRAAERLGGARAGSPAAGFEPLRIVVGGNFTPVPTQMC
jgi:uncharacterized protein (TIGR01615 family)